MRQDGSPEFCHPEFGCDCGEDQFAQLKTIGDLSAFLHKRGLERLRLHLVFAKGADGNYIFGPDDPISGPFSSDTVR